VTIGSVEPLRRLYARWGDRVQFLEVFIRQAHPGPGVPPYRDFSQKMQDARRYVTEEGIPWVVLVDDLGGTVHQRYGGLADPSYLIDANGRVAYYNLWTYAPALHAAIDDLLAQGERGVVRGGTLRLPNLLPAMTAGWRALRRGLPQSYLDLELATPGAATATAVGSALGLPLRPLTQRATPLPPAARVGLAAGAGAIAALGVRWMVKRRRG
jgi:hypothetical protein